MLETRVGAMRDFDVLHREFQQCGRSYIVQFAIDRTNKKLYINEFTLFKLIGQFPAYRRATDPLVPSIANHKGQWFDITEVSLTLIRPVFVANWLIETVDLLKRFYLTEPRNFDDRRYKFAREILQAWEG